MNFLIFKSLLPGMRSLPAGSEKILFRETTHPKNEKRRRNLFVQTVAKERKWLSLDAYILAVIPAQQTGGQAITTLHKWPFVMR